MKKLIFLMLVILSLGQAYDSKAQASFSQTASNPTGAILNNAADTMTYTLTKGYGRILFSVTYTRLTGTAAGTAVLEYKVGSTDNWASDSDPITVTNVASQTLYWNKTNTARYWRIRVSGGTTVTATVSAKLQTD